MTQACIGWLADPPCDVHGITHGCRWPEGHTGGRHECICGATCRSSTARLIHDRTVKCGTYAGYRKHRRNGEPTCQPCRDAWAEGQRQYNKPKKDVA